MKLYHFNFETTSYKFVETRYAILNSESAPATTMTIPFTFSPSSTVGSLRVGLTSPPHLQPQSSNCPSNPSAAIAATLPPQSSSPPTITSAVGSTSSRFLAQSEPIQTVPERTNSVQGSRRRKATTPPSLDGTVVVTGVCVSASPFHLFDDSCHSRGSKTPAMAATNRGRRSSHPWAHARTSHTFTNEHPPAFYSRTSP
ncbi:unnamed protein product [Hydatigera taeniaeformis]|uniref:Uncharacterized protein n=1 Tax=Hydatigena taeniaeformis TaxID=6205 RepID=A0A0R3WKY3_HYDTA|nr:unnamed protein product [Hydatigera taeniaeformis]